MAMESNFAYPERIARAARLANLDRDGQRPRLVEAEVALRVRGRLRSMNATFVRVTLVSAVAMAAFGLTACQTLSAAQPRPRSPAGPGSFMPVPSPSVQPSRLRLAMLSDLPRLISPPPEAVLFQTATRPDLTGTITLQGLTSDSERQALQTAGFQGGQRLTMGDPAGHGINVMRASAELFPSGEAAEQALSYYQTAFRDAGYTELVDSSVFGAASFARAGDRVAVAPQLAQGAAGRAYVFGWVQSNVLLILVIGGEAGIDQGAANPWGRDMVTNITATLSVPPTKPSG